MSKILKSEMTVEGELRLAHYVMQPFAYYFVYLYFHERAEPACNETVGGVVECRTYHGSYDTLEEAEAKFKELLG